MKSPSAIWIFAAFFLLIACNVPLKRDGSGHYKQGAVVSAHPLTSQVGLEILQKGGNAYDAAIAMQFALAVVSPRAGNIGGGGFMLSYHAAEQKVEALDFREQAPLAAHRDMFLDSQGNLLTNASLKGHLAAGVPGSVMGMHEIHKRYGSMTWEELIDPAIKLAGKGFLLTAFEAAQFNRFLDDFVTHSTVFPAFMRNLKKGQLIAGDSLYMTDLAKTLQRIALYGAKDFYEGETAGLIVAEMERGGGIITREDLKAYRAVWREAVHFDYQGAVVYTMPLPSAGGVALPQFFYAASQVNWDSIPHHSAMHLHLVTEWSRRIYADRASYLGDSDFADVPLEMLLSETYLQERFAGIDIKRATLSSDIKQAAESTIESMETTHFTTADRWGNVVAVTTTVNGFFGNKVMVGDAGFFLNNEMDDFAAQPGKDNQFGLIGSEANRIEAQKRMLSSMSPTIVLKDNVFWFTLGTPGGSTIITNVFQTTLNVLAYGMRMQDAVDSKKIHAQWLPDELIYEFSAIDSLIGDELIQMGHLLQPVGQLGRMNAIMKWPDGYEAAADNKREGDCTAMGF